MDETVGKNAGRKLYEDGRAAMGSKDYAAAVEKLTASVDMSPHFKTYELRAECHLELKNFPQAIKYAAAAAGIGNNQFRARLVLAKALIEYGEVQWAVDKLNEALRMNPDYKAACDMLATLRENGVG